MAGEDNTEFDPRFDRAFQRGFDGEVTSRAPQPTAYLPTNPVRSTLPPAPVISPAQDAGAVRQDGADYPGFAPGATASQGAAPALSPPGEVEAAAEAERPAGRNPFLIGLTVISVVLVIGGLAGLQWLRGRFLAPDIATELDFVTVQAATTGLVIVIGLGLATAIGVLFVHAANWSKRRS